MDIRNFGRWDFGIFILLTVLAILNGQTTIFYIIYFFWWNEFIRVIVDRLLYKKNSNALLVSGGQNSMFGNFFLMGIYFVFIVVFFAVIANWRNQDITFINLNILFFKNWFFNINLIIVLVQRIYLHTSKQELLIPLGLFTPNMIVLHISIIVGGLIMFFIVKQYPETFTPDNLWGSVIIVLPFLFLKWIVYYFTNYEEKAQSRITE